MFSIQINFQWKLDESLYYLQAVNSYFCCKAPSLCVIFWINRDCHRQLCELVFQGPVSKTGKKPETGLD